MTKKTRCFLYIYCFLILPFGSFSKPFIYTFNIKIRYPSNIFNFLSNGQLTEKKDWILIKDLAFFVLYPPTYLKPKLPLSGGASCRIRYYHRQLPGRSAGENFPKVFASLRETDIFSYVSPGAERCLSTRP